MFRLAGRVRDLATIRQAAILEIVEQVPVARPGLPPVVRTLDYPISVRLTRSEPLPRTADGAANSGGNTNGNDNDAAGHGPWRGHQRWRGRKRRHTATAPDGRADGMAVDSADWTRSNACQRTDGVAPDRGWLASRAATTVLAPPPV